MTLTTMHNRSRLQRQDFADTMPMPMPAEAATDICARPQRRKTDPGYIGWGALLPAVLVLAAVGVLALARWVLT